MTIEEAIEHCEEVAQENEKQFNGCPMKYEGAYANNGKTACKCAEEHRQLAEWLKDYKRLLDQQPCEDANVKLIHTQGLDEGIRCAMCTNLMANDRGCDGACVVNEIMYKKVLDVIGKQIIDKGEL